jgi:hypothetical protein
MKNAARKFQSLQARTGFETKFVRPLQEQNPAVDFAAYIDLGAGP